jgi:hypothetical protein
MTGKGHTGRGRRRGVRPCGRGAPNVCRTRASTSLSGRARDATSSYRSAAIGDLLPDAPQADVCMARPGAKSSMAASRGSKLVGAGTPEAAEGTLVGVKDSVAGGRQRKRGEHSVTQRHSEITVYAGDYLEYELVEHPYSCRSSQC